MNHVTNSLSSAEINIFFTENYHLLLYQEIQIQILFRYIFLIPLTFHETLRIVLINMVTILMISTKIATPGLLKIKVF